MAFIPKMEGIWPILLGTFEVQVGVRGHAGFVSGLAWLWPAERWEEPVRKPSTRGPKISQKHKDPNMVYSMAPYSMVDYGMVYYSMVWYSINTRILRTIISGIPPCIRPWNQNVRAPSDTRSKPLCWDSGTLLLL